MTLATTTATGKTNALSIKCLSRYGSRPLLRQSGLYLLLARRSLLARQHRGSLSRLLKLGVDAPLVLCKRWLHPNHFQWQFYRCHCRTVFFFYLAAPLPTHDDACKCHCLTARKSVELTAKKATDCARLPGIPFVIYQDKSNVHAVVLFAQTSLERNLETLNIGTPLSYETAESCS